MRTIDQVINEFKLMKVRRDTGEGVFIGDARIIDETLEYLKEAKGLAIYQAQLGSELANMQGRHRKFTRTAAIAAAAGDTVFPVKITDLDAVAPNISGGVGKITSATERYMAERHVSGHGVDIG